MSAAQFANYLVAWLFTLLNGHPPVVEDHPWPTAQVQEAPAPAETITASIPGPVIIETTDIPAAEPTHQYNPNDNSAYLKQ